MRASQTIQLRNHASIIIVAAGSQIPWTQLHKTDIWNNEEKANAMETIYAWLKSHQILYGCSSLSAHRHAKKRSTDKIIGFKLLLALDIFGFWLPPAAVSFILINPIYFSLDWHIDHFTRFTVSLWCTDSHTHTHIVHVQLTRLTILLKSHHLRSGKLYRKRTRKIPVKQTLHNEEARLWTPMYLGAMHEWV